MRGQPFLQLLLVVAAFVAMGWPVSRLTRPAAVGASASNATPFDATPPSETEMTIFVTAVPAPREFSLRHLGRELLVGQGPQTRWVIAWRTALAAEGADLALQVHWPAGSSPAAVRVTIHAGHDAEPRVEKTFWCPGGDTLTELVTVPAANP